MTTWQPRGNSGSVMERWTQPISPVEIGVGVDDMAVTLESRQMLQPDNSNRKKHD